MAEFKARQHHGWRPTGQTLGVINGKAYSATNVYVIRSSRDDNDHHFHNYESSASNYHHHHQAVVSKAAAPPCKSSSWAVKRWMDYSQLKRRNRIAKYKLYAYEAQIKNSFKNGLRLIKRTCRRMVHGF